LPTLIEQLIPAPGTLQPCGNQKPAGAGPPAFARGRDPGTLSGPSGDRCDFPRGPPLWASILRNVWFSSMRAQKRAMLDGNVFEEIRPRSSGLFHAPETSSHGILISSSPDAQDPLSCRTARGRSPEFFKDVSGRKRVYLSLKSGRSGGTFNQTSAPSKDIRAVRCGGEYPIVRTGYDAQRQCSILGGARAQICSNTGPA